MKKTIAILLVLVLAGAGLFAADPANPTVSAAVQITTNIPSVAIFGVSTSAVDSDTAFTSVEAFNTAIEDSVEYTTTGTATMAEFVNPITVGYLSGMNNTAADVKLKFSVTSFTTIDFVDATPIPLEVTTDVPVKINKAVSAMGTLKNVPITVKVPDLYQALIALAPASNQWKATVTISVDAT